MTIDYTLMPGSSNRRATPRLEVEELNIQGARNLGTTTKIIIKSNIWSSPLLSLPIIRPPNQFKNIYLLFSSIMKVGSDLNSAFLNLVSLVFNIQSIDKANSMVILQG